MMETEDVMEATQAWINRVDWLEIRERVAKGAPP